MIDEKTLMQFEAALGMKIKDTHLFEKCITPLVVKNKENSPTETRAWNNVGTIGRMVYELCLYQYFFMFKTQTAKLI